MPTSPHAGDSSVSSASKASSPVQSPATTQSPSPHDASSRQLLSLWATSFLPSPERNPRSSASTPSASPATSSTRFGVIAASSLNSPSPPLLTQAPVSCSTRTRKAAESASWLNSRLTNCRIRASTRSKPISSLATSPTAASTNSPPQSSQCSASPPSASSLTILKKSKRSKPSASPSPNASPPRFPQNPPSRDTFGDGDAD